MGDTHGWRTARRAKVHAGVCAVRSDEGPRFRARASTARRAAAVREWSREAMKDRVGGGEGGEMMRDQDDASDARGVESTMGLGRDWRVAWRDEKDARRFRAQDADGVEKVGGGARELWVEGGVERSGRGREDARVRGSEADWRRTEARYASAVIGTSADGGC